MATPCRRSQPDPGLVRTLALVAALHLAGCSPLYWKAGFVPVEGPEGYALLEADEAPFVKVHTEDGGVYVLRDWAIDRESQELSGTGILYDADREEVGRGEYTLSPDVPILVETNTPEAFAHAPYVALGLVTGASLLVTAACVIHPKACFGSCPTFYADDGEGLAIQAEGFSDAIARGLERTDVDALSTARPEDGTLDLRLTNDALETHAIRHVSVLAAPHAPGERVYQSPEGFVVGQAQHAPSTCTSRAGDCTETVRHFDQREYLSETDPQDLATLEHLELTFPHPEGPLGLAIGARQGLVTTFVFYQWLAYMGSDAGEWFARIEQHPDRATKIFARLRELLGEIEVAVWMGSRWQAVGAYAEPGPIAREVELLALPEDLPAGAIRVRLTLPRGGWRIDQAALVELGETVEPRRIQPREVRTPEGDPAPDVLARLTDPERYLVTYPGSAFSLTFDLPPGEHELFLESRGYYYEWMRESWLAEEDPAALMALATRPRLMLRRLAPAYKQLEPDIERLFWESRIGRHE